MDLLEVEVCHVGPSELEWGSFEGRVKGGETSGGVEKFQVTQLSYHHVFCQLVALEY
jgi:hypothetical protein